MNPLTGTIKKSLPTNTNRPADFVIKHVITGPEYTERGSTDINSVGLNLDTNGLNLKKNSNEFLINIVLITFLIIIFILLFKNLIQPRWKLFIENWPRIDKFKGSKSDSKYIKLSFYNYLMLSNIIFLIASSAYFILFRNTELSGIYKPKTILSTDNIKQLATSATQVIKDQINNKNDIINKIRSSLLLLISSLIGLAILSTTFYPFFPLVLAGYILYTKREKNENNIIEIIIVVVSILFMMIGILLEIFVVPKLNKIKESMTEKFEKNNYFLIENTDKNKKINEFYNLKVDKDGIEYK